MRTLRYVVITLLLSLWALPAHAQGSIVRGPGSGGAGGGLTGSKATNTAAPGSDNIGAFGCVANAASPTLTETYLTACSQDLHGGQRITVMNADGSASLLSDSASSIYALQSAATTNASTIKASAGQLYSLVVTNFTATPSYVRFYNLAANPTCSSATGFVGTLGIPASTTGAGVSVQINVGAGFTTGIALCWTGGASSTDNTATGTGQQLLGFYR